MEVSKSEKVGVGFLKFFLKTKDLIANFSLELGINPNFIAPYVFLFPIASPGLIMAYLSSSWLGFIAALSSLNVICGLSNYFLWRAEKRYGRFHNQKLKNIKKEKIESDLVKLVEEYDALVEEYKEIPFDYKKMPLLYAYPKKLKNKDVWVDRIGLTVGVDIKKIKKEDLEEIINKIKPCIKEKGINIENHRVYLTKLRAYGGDTFPYSSISFLSDDLTELRAAYILLHEFGHEKNLDETKNQILVMELLKELNKKHPWEGYNLLELRFKIICALDVYIAKLRLNNVSEEKIKEIAGNYLPNEKNWKRFLNQRVFLNDGIKSFFRKRKQKLFRRYYLNTYLAQEGYQAGN